MNSLRLSILLILLSLSLSSRLQSSLSSSRLLLKPLLPSLSLSLSLLLCQPCLAIEEPPPSGTCTTTSNPSATIQYCRQLGLENGRLRSCQANENCFSTSSKSASKYISPWQYEFSSKPTNEEETLETVAWNKLKQAVEDNGLKILQDKVVDNGQRYLLAAEKGSSVSKQPSGSSLFYEFTLKDEDKLILFRAVVDKTVFLYPLQQPISDFGALQSKLDAIRNSANFLQVGANSDSDDAILFSQ